MVCLDTSFIADLFRKDKEAIRKLEEFIEKNEKLVTAIINVAELYKGAYGHYRKEEKIKEVDELSQIIFVLEMNIRAAKNYGYYCQYLKGRGKMIDDRDILIASIILSYGEDKIVTRNVEHFRRIEEIEVIEY
ncbi:MAG: type II toxin-antitoxin system VapC family toxin [Candidatus Thermoplasmatota archaeon]|nr:type II toxin-antitoxin system VapC family toxin [Candidatus Thermoplasmatota archaeon]